MSARIAVLCSGQGGQGRGMFGWLAEAPEAADVFASAAAVLGEDPRRFVRDRPEACLFGNRAGQILCVTAALAAWSVIRPAIDTMPAGAVVVAGYSIGELSAWGCAGLLDAGRTLALAGERAALMDQAAPPNAGLAAIAGLAQAVLEPLLRRHNLSVAINNGESGVVAGGDAAGLAALIEEARALGARRAVRLPVSVPSHTAALRTAAERFGALLEGETFRPACGAVRLLSGIDGATVRNPRLGARALSAQIAQTVRWDACLQSCRELGAARVLELGPGAALSAMADAAYGRPVARAMSQFRGADGVRDWLSRAGAG